MQHFRRVCAGAALASVAAFSVGPGAHAAGGELSGTWTSIDTDGSSQTLQITGSGIRTYAMSLLDDAATACGGAPASVVGTGQRDGDTLVLVGSLSCHPGGNIFRGRIGFGFDYASENDTLTDESGVVWTR